MQCYNKCHSQLFGSKVGSATQAASHQQAAQSQQSSSSTNLQRGAGLLRLGCRSHLHQPKLEGVLVARGSQQLHFVHGTISAERWRGESRTATIMSAEQGKKMTVLGSLANPNRAQSRPHRAAARRPVRTCGRGR